MKMTSKTIFRLNRIFILFLLLVILDVRAQDTIMTNEEPMIKVDEMPRFPGCEDFPSISERDKCAKTKMLEYIFKNLKYPEKARKKNVEGLVVLQFVVTKDGGISGINVVKDIGHGCGNAAKIAIASMNNMKEKWIPGKQKEKNVEVLLTMPVIFKLEDTPITKRRLNKLN